MNKILVVFVLGLILSCKETPKAIQTETSVSTKMQIDTTRYPEALNKIFTTHGGLLQWRSQKTLSYVMPNETNGSEQQTIDLWTRKEKIENPNFAMGYDGKDFWLADVDEKYKGDPIFYHNLMFYFYAMPFVLADDGINYGETEHLEFEGKSYPGIRISYNDGVGVSSKDEYFIHYDAETNQMAWLGYTVTYRTGEKSDRTNWIRYNDWQEVNGLVLPKSITWHQVKEGVIGAAASTRAFENVSLLEIEKPEDFYGAPENSKIVSKK